MSRLIPTPPQKKPKKSSFFPLLAVAFFCIWLIWRSFTPVLPVLGEPPRLYANPSRQDLHLTLLRALRNAHSSIYLSMFGLSDPPVLATLSKKIQEKISVAIVYDPAGSANLRNLLPGATIQPARQAAGLMHRKILILDDATIFLGSANFTTPSLKMHDNLVVGFISPKIAQFLKNPPASGGHLRSLVGGQDVELWLLPDPKGHALNDLRKKIRNATKTLHIALFTLTHNGLTEDLIRAHKKGVSVTVAIDKNSALGASYGCMETLKAAGIEVISSAGVQLMHHKFAWIDGDTLITGSANWTQSAFTKNSDCLLILHNLNQEQKKIMTHLWNRIQTTAYKR